MREKAQTLTTALGDVEFSLSGQTNLPVLLGVHGGIGGHDQAEALLSWVNPDRYRMLCPSRPGYLGTPISSGRSVEEQADLFAALLDALAIESVGVVAGSAGGPSAYTFAIRHPDRVHALVAVDCVSGHYDMPETAGPVAQALFMTAFGQDLLRMVERSRPDVILEQVFQAEGLFTKAQRKAHVAAVLASPAKLAFLKSFMDTMFPYARRKVGTDNDMEQFRRLTHLPVERIACPTLVLHGTHDADVKFYDGVYAFEHIPGAERFWIEEGSHLGFWLSPHADEAQRTASRFLERRGEG